MLEKNLFDKEVQIYAILVGTLVIILTWLLLKYVIHFDLIINADRSHRKKKTVAKMYTLPFVASIVLFIAYLIYKSSIITMMFDIVIIMTFTMQFFFWCVVKKEDDDKDSFLNQ
ncbi:MAG: hypothetical protein IKW01_06805 [Firmicutes bacterium]|nr:hypothetical protein [Bacillota bacterium]